MRKFILLILTCEVLFSVPNMKDTIVSKALEVQHKLHDVISKNVKSKISQDGIYTAAEFCAKESYKKIEELNKTLDANISVKRVSLKNRNPNSYPQDDEKKILEALELIEKSNAYLPSEIVQLNEEGEYKVYFPSTMSSKNCKSCHGAKEGVNKEVYELFKSKYPQDKAFDFGSGEVRGAVIVTVKQK